MTLRSRLFAGVALPILSVTMTVQPVLAASAGQSFELAQASEEQQPPVLPQDQQQPQPEEQPAPPPAEEPQAQAPQPEPQPAPAEEPAPAPQEQPQAEAPPPAEQPAPEPQPKAEAQPQAEPQPEPQAVEPPAPAEQPKAEQPAAEPPAAPAQKQEAAPAEAPQPAQPDAAPADQPPAAEQQPPAAQPNAKQPEAQPPAAEQPAAPQPEGQQQTQPQGEAPPAAPQGEQPAAPPADGQAPAAPAQPQGENGAAAPAPPPAEDNAAAPPAPAAPIVDTRSVEENQAIAADPAKTDETVVLPVANGAAVLDSDKDADNRGGQSAREERRQQREAQRTEEAAPPPKTDVEAQAAAPQVDASQLRQQIEEKGQRIEQAPQFALPMAAGAAAGDNTTINNNTVNNTVVNNTVNNTVVNNSTVNNVVVVQQNDNRAVLRVDDRLVVRSDDRPRLSRDAEQTYYDRLPRGRYRETIERPNGARLVTVYNQYGDIIQRSRISADGEEYLLVYAPDADSDRPPLVHDAGDDLPPMRLRIPVDDYIIDTSRNPDRDYYAFLSEPPVERVERTYSIDEVKYSARLRDKVRRIDLDTITFATGSAEVPMNQARTLRTVAEAIQKVLKRDPGETFLIEGHTDAVGSDQSNLILSDKRADSVASLLTEVYGIPPENLVTQGYGERYLKVRTQVAEQQNRRVTIRRVTPLVRPVARN